MTSPNSALSKIRDNGPSVGGGRLSGNGMRSHLVGTILAVTEEFHARLTRPEPGVDRRPRMRLTRPRPGE